ncbi:MAG TPA: hypothetical protein VIW45_14845 [Vicinamibacterales bacterium]|jgi:DnaJ-domain-containing protein 1
MFTAPALAFALAVGVQLPPEPAIPTTIERGVLDRACKESAEQPDVNEKCRDENLAALRSDFGKDLAKVSTADRKKVDDTCTPLLANAALKGREPYFDCMLEQLVLISRTRKRGGNAFAQTAASSSSAAATPTTTTAAPAPQAAGGSRTVMLAAIGVVAVAGAIAFVAMRSKKPAARQCRSCGTTIPADFELCANCRREAAEALRRANAERAEQMRQAAEDARREEERQQVMLHRQKVREEEERRLREHEEMRQREHASAEPVSAAANASEPPALAADSDVFDPHAILGVKADATPEAITAAYEAAKKKYDPDLVGHLSEEVQAHYRDKAQAVEKAYRTLTGGPQAA